MNLAYAWATELHAASGPLPGAGGVRSMLVGEGRLIEPGSSKDLASMRMAVASSFATILSDPSGLPSDTTCRGRLAA